MQRRKRLALRGVAVAVALGLYDLYLVTGHVQFPRDILLAVGVNVGGAIFLFVTFVSLLFYAQVERVRRVRAEFDEAGRAAGEQSAWSPKREPPAGPPGHVPRAELQALYRELVKKYHPDFARGEEDKRFRTDLTAKINRAYAAGDIATLRLFR